MKTSIATTLSVVGVLAAGGMAFAVNTSVLDSAIQTSNVTPALEATITNSPITTSLPVTVQSNATESSSAAVTYQIAEQTSYNIDGVAVVTLLRDRTSLTVVNVSPISGYRYEALNETASRVEITFVKGAAAIRFNADIIGDRVITSVMNETQAVAAAPSPHPYENDDENEDHEDEEDEENHEEGEDDDD